MPTLRFSEWRKELKKATQDLDRVSFILYLVLEIFNSLRNIRTLDLCDLFHETIFFKFSYVLDTYKVVYGGWKGEGEITKFLNGLQKCD